MFSRALLLLAVVLVTLGAGAWWRSRQGRVRAPRRTDAPPASATATREGWRERGVELADRATFVQFSTTFCSPCRATSRSLGEVSSAYDDVAYVELDIDEHPALVRELSVLRAPTVVVLDPRGAEVARMSGAVTQRQAREALDVLPA